MRIIGGEHRGRRITAPPGRGTRPMLDRVREALFATLAGRVEGARVLDLFAGSGSLGLEALSRGARRVRMVEKSRRAADLLRRNAEALGLAERAEIRCADALRPAGWSDGEEEAPPRYDVVLYDPPYGLLERAATRRRVLAVLHRLALEVLAQDGVLVFHAPRGAISEEELGPDLAAEERAYGSSALWYVRPRAAGSTSEAAEP